MRRCSISGVLLFPCLIVLAADNFSLLLLLLLFVLTIADAAPEDAALQHQRAKEMLQLTEWMAAVGQGHKDMLVRHKVPAFSLVNHSLC
jgi:hypothetical protein